MTEIIKVMLASGITDYDKVTYPKYLSPKLDGIRVVINNGVVYSRSGKPIRSKVVQELFGRPDMNMLDGELIYGTPTAHNVFNATSSFVMSESVPEGMSKDNIHLYVFDFVDNTKHFSQRNIVAGHIVEAARWHKVPVSLITQTVVNDSEEMLAHEARLLSLGYEGVMIRSIQGMYKHGLATEKSQDLLKVKRFVDDESEIIGYEELMHNGNEATTNELGRTERSSHKENLMGMDTLGALVCKTKEGVVFKIGTGYDADTRKKLWNIRGTLLRQLVKYKSFPIGVKDAPRLPVFLGLRDKDDL